MENDHIEAIDSLYCSRTDFTIIALTGQTATGRSRLASFMADKNFLQKEDAHVRTPDSVTPHSFSVLDNTELYKQNKVDDCNNAITSMVFSRKYKICYNFIKENYEAFEIIKYNHVLWLFSLLKMVDNVKNKDGNKAQLLKKLVDDLLDDKYRPSHKNENDIDYKNLCDNMSQNGCRIYKDYKKLIESYDYWENLYNQLEPLSDVLNNLSSKNHYSLYNVFSSKDGAFFKFVRQINNDLAKLDYYCLCFLYHRLGVVIRNTGNPLESSKDSYRTMGNDNSHVYDVAMFINLLIKGCRKYKGDIESNSGNKCRIVIDSIRNSMEALYFKERYTAFYMIAVHDDENAEEHFKSKLESLCKDLEDVAQKQIFINAQLRKVFALGCIESKGKEVENGKFASPNVAQCIADSEIHIQNTNCESDNNSLSFFSMAEQWMKYAALILHPGLITPSSEERCMEVAFTAKLNSGCLSRQVGAVITNKYHSIRTIGWNDVPYGQIPCSLRDLSELVSPNPSEFVYSAYERNNGKKFHENFSFVENIKKDYPTILKPQYRQLLKGLPLSYCFKSLQNKYEGEKNQVYTRSLHAEENAMMQMVKFGGESLMDGIIYVTASPCDLCCKKLYQIGVRKIVYIDEYPGISRRNIIENGYKRPALKQFQGAYGATYYKLYQPFMAYKDEIAIRTDERSSKLKTSSELLNGILKEMGSKMQNCYSQNDYEDVIKTIKDLKEKADKYDKLQG